jgi:hypothetical protein
MKTAQQREKLDIVARYASAVKTANPNAGIEHNLAKIKALYDDNRAVFPANDSTFRRPSQGVGLYPPLVEGDSESTESVAPRLVPCATPPLYLPLIDRGGAGKYVSEEARHQRFFTGLKLLFVLGAIVAFYCGAAGLEIPGTQTLVKNIINLIWGAK